METGVFAVMANAWGIGKGRGVPSFSFHADRSGVSIMLYTFPELVQLDKVPEPEML